MATTTAADTASSVNMGTVDDLAHALAPKAYHDENGFTVPNRSEKVAARRILAHLWCDIDAGRPCAAASYAMRMSDGSTVPFRLWAETVLGIREAGKAYATGTV